MSFPRVKTTGWAFGEKLTSAQMNTLDIDHSNAVDKRSGALEVDSHTIRREQPIIIVAANDGTDSAIPGKWYFDAAALMWRAADASSGSSVALVALTNIPDKASLTGIRYWVDGTGFTSLPSPDMPLFSLKYLDAAGAVQTAPPGAVDDGADLATFNTFHEIAVTISPAISIDQTATPRAFFAHIDYRSAGSAGAGRTFHLGRIQMDFTITRLTPG